MVIAIRRHSFVNVKQGILAKIVLETCVLNNVLDMDNVLTMGVFVI